MLNLELVQTDKHSINDLLQPKISDFYVEQIIIQTRWQQLKTNFNTSKN